MHRRRLATLALLVILPGCRATDPTPIAFELVLEAVAGEALPVVITAGEFATMTLFADTILLREDGTGIRIRRVHLITDAVEIPDPGPYRRYADEFTYQLRDGRFELAFPCPDLGLCIAPPHLSGDLSGELLIATEPSAPQREMRYRVRSGAPPGTSLTR